MPNLYEIEKAMLECIDLETGELIDFERFDRLQMEREQKIENVVLWIKNLQSDALAFKAEKDSFAEREKAATKKAEQLKGWLSQVLEGQKFSTAKCAVSFRKSTKLEVLDETIIPKELMVKTESINPDANAIKALLKAGQEVKGCRLIENLNPQIK